MNRPLTRSERDELDGLRREVRELRELVEEYERADGDEPDLEQVELRQRVAEVFKTHPAYRAAGNHQLATRTILFLLTKPGRAFSKEVLLEGVKKSSRETVHLRYADFAVGVTRAYLRRLGFQATIETVPGFGWRLRAAVAREIRHRLGLADA